MKIQETILYAIAKFHLERLRNKGELRYSRAWYLMEGEYADSQSTSHSKIRSLFYNACDFKEKTVLDIGSGNGNGLPDFCKRAGLVLALDYDLYDMNHCADYLKLAGCNNYRLVVGDAAKLPFDSDSVDIVTMQDSFEHFVEYENAYSEALRVLKRDGFLFIVTCFLHSPGHSHLTDLIKLLHVDVFFRKEAILNVYGMLAQEEEKHIGSEDDLLKWRKLTKWHMVQFRDFLNFASLRKFERMVQRNAPVSVVLYKKMWSGARMGLLFRLFPFLHTFFLKSIVIGLQKAPKDRRCSFPGYWSIFNEAMKDLRTAFANKLGQRLIR